MKPATLRLFRILRSLGLWRTYRSWRSIALLVLLLAPLARWLCVSDCDIATIFPYLANFGSGDLGFLT